VSKKTDTWMPIYVGDYLADTGHLSATEHGGYFLMLMHYWRTGTALPEDDNQLRRIARMTAEEWAASKSTLLAFFELSEKGWFHKRVETELMGARLRSEVAKAKADERWKRDRGDKPDAPVMPQQSPGTAPALPGDMPSACSSSSSSSSSSSESSPPPVKDAGASPAKRARRAVAATPLPMDWKPNSDEIELAESLGLNAIDIERDAAKFRWYYTKAKGAGRRCTPRGWMQAWGNWIGKSAERLPDSPETAETNRAAYKPADVSWRWASGLGEGSQIRIADKLKPLAKSNARFWVSQCGLDVDGPTLIIRAPNMATQERIVSDYETEIKKLWGAAVSISLDSDGARA
jgi:uncharacterized protein YdaU (DUF1376 family)